MVELWSGFLSHWSSDCNVWSDSRKWLKFETWNLLKMQIKKSNNFENFSGEIESCEVSVVDFSGTLDWTDNADSFETCIYWEKCHEFHRLSFSGTHVSSTKRLFMAFGCVSSKKPESTRAKGEVWSAMDHQLSSCKSKRGSYISRRRSHRFSPWSMLIFSANWRWLIFISSLPHCIIYSAIRNNKISTFFLHL